MKRNAGPRAPAQKTGPILKPNAVELDHCPSQREPGSARGTSELGSLEEAHCTPGPIDFVELNRVALAAFPAVLARVLPDGKRVGAELVALNPRRGDRHLGSFKINRYNGRWADFATGDQGGDPVSLVAYLANVSQVEAARAASPDAGPRGAEGVAMSDAHDRFAPLTARERSAHQMKERQKPDDGELVVPVPPDAPAPPASHIRP